ncbi:MAG: EamA family transporter, partial [Clostridia bacterium]|nr:EamA family transporter [Clostridia bacterium]
MKISENVSIIKEVLRKDTVMSILYAIISTIALSISIIFAKIGVKKANPSVVTALRTLIVSLGAWIILIFEKKTGLISTADGTDWLYIILTALAFCIALICYHISLKAGSITGVSSLMYIAPWLLIILNLFNKATASAFIPIVY